MHQKSGQSKSELYWEHFGDDLSKEAAYKQTKRLPLVVVAHNIRSLFNVGSLLRTAEGVLLEKVWLGGYTGTPPRKEITKTALGAEEMIPWEYAKDVYALLRRLKDDGRVIYGLENCRESISIGDVKLRLPAALIIGNEIDGLPSNVLKLCDQVLHLPMRGAKTSLNVAVACGAAAYEFLRQWEKTRI